MIRFLCLSLFLFLPNIFANQTEELSEAQKIQKSVDGIKAEVESVEQYLKEVKEHEIKINEFRAQFSDLITNVATNNAFKIQSQNNKKVLEELETEVTFWLEQAELKQDKINDLLTVLNQASKSYRESAKKSKGKIRSAYRSFYNTTNNSIITLKSSLTKVEKHLKFLNSFKKDMEKWKDFLVEKIKKGLNQNLLKWQLNSFYTNPISAIEVFQKDITTVLLLIKNFDYNEFYQEQKGTLYWRLFLSLAMALAIIFFSFKLQAWSKGPYSELIPPNISSLIETLTEHKILLSLASLYVLTTKDLGPFSFEIYPAHIGLAFHIIIFATFWIFFAHPSLSVFIREINKNRTTGKEFSFSRIPLLIYIVTRSIQSLFELDTDILYLINGTLLAWISYKFVIFCLRFKVDQESYKIQDLALFLHSTKIFFSLFAVALFGSSLMEVTGFSNLGRSIQTVVFSNVLYLAFGWLLYKSLVFFLEYRRSNTPRGKFYSKKMEFIDFFSNLLNTGFIAAFIIIILKSLHSTIFVFADFWDVAIFSIDNYRFTIDKPVKLLSLYFFIRFSYLTLIYLLDAFLLEKMNIEKRHSANVASIVRYLFILFFLSLGLASLGVTYKNLIIFASALGVGIGFGLQNIVNNFISGIILLFEQPIRVGDIIEVNNFFSRVKHIGIRSTIVESLDNSSIIIPNSEILSNKLTNWTLNNNVIAIHCKVGVAYGTDTQMVSDILDQIATDHEMVLTNPKHQVWFTNFGDSSLDFNLKAFINKPIEKFSVHSQLMHEINAKLKEADVTIPFPQRDVHLYST